MEKKVVRVLASIMVFTMMSSVVAFAAESKNVASEAVILDGDMSIEEGAEPGIPAADEAANAKKLAEMQTRLSMRLSGPTYMSLNVPTCEQINGYYCGPATVQQTIKFYKGSAPSQDTIASQLGTTTDGTDMTRIAGVVNNNLGYSQYSMIAIGTQTDWANKVTYALSINKPVIIDIKAASGSGWPYTTNGHFMNVSGHDRSSSVSKAKVTDPWKLGLGSHWYNESLVYKVNNAHFRQAMIW